jgi:molecular chaperone GrpE
VAATRFQDMNDENQVTESAETARPGSDMAEVSDPAVALASVVAERDQLAKEKADYYDQLLRRTAEFENFRKRAQRERSETLEYAGMEAVREMLPILDDFERALKVESAAPEYAKGMELIYQRLFGILKKIGLEPMTSEGQPFDPHVHHAVEMVSTDECEDHTVVQELQRGYNFKGRLLRPAMVRVAVRP